MGDDQSPASVVEMMHRWLSRPQRRGVDLGSAMLVCRGVASASFLLAVSCMWLGCAIRWIYVGIVHKTPLVTFHFYAIGVLLTINKLIIYYLFRISLLNM